MLEKLKKIITIISLAVAVLVSVCAILFAANQTKFGGMFDVAFWILLCYIGLSLLIWLIYGIISLKDKKKKTIIFVAAIIVVLAAAIVLSLGDTMPELFLNRYNTSASTAKFIAIACYTTYFVVLGALALMIFSAISKALKK